MLMADLDLSSAEQASISVFRGTLDGNNHTIKGLKQALFQVLEEGTVSNLNLSGVQISGSGDAGALANVIGTGKKVQLRSRISRSPEVLQVPGIPEHWRVF